MFCNLFNQLHHWCPWCSLITHKFFVSGFYIPRWWFNITRKWINHVLSGRDWNKPCLLYFLVTFPRSRWSWRTHFPLLSWLMWVWNWSPSYGLTSALKALPWLRVDRGVVLRGAIDQTAQFRWWPPWQEPQPQQLLVFLVLSFDTQKRKKKIADIAGHRKRPPSPPLSSPCSATSTGRRWSRDLAINSKC